MKNDQIQFLGFFAEEFRRLARNELVARSVEAVTANFIFFIIFVRNTVHISVIGDRLVETRIKNSDLGNARHDLFAGFDTVEIGGVMKRTEGETVADRLLDLGGNENGTGYLVSSVQNAVPDRLDLGNGRDDPVFLAYERVENYFQRRRMIGHIDIRLILFRIGLESERARCALDADPVAKSLCDDLFGLDVKQLIFQRRRAGVDNKNLHFFPPVFSARIRNNG